MIDSKTKPKGEKSIVIKAIDTSSNTQNILALRFKTIQEKNQFSSIHQQLLPSFAENDQSPVINWKCGYCTSLNVSVDERCIECGITRECVIYLPDDIYTHRQIDSNECECTVCTYRNKISELKYRACQYTQEMSMDAVKRMIEINETVEINMKDTIYKISLIISGFFRSTSTSINIGPVVIELCTKFFVNV